MQKEMKEKKDLQTMTEPLEEKDIDAGSVYEDGLRQNKRPYVWDSEEKVDVKEPRLTRFMTERRRQRSDFEGKNWTSMIQESITDEIVSLQEAHQAQVTSVSDAVAPHLLYCGPFSFPSVATPGRFLSTSEYVTDKHTLSSATSHIEPPTVFFTFSKRPEATHYYNFSEQPFEGSEFMFSFNNMPFLLSDAEFSAVSYQYSLLSFKHSIDDSYLSIVLNKSACGVQDLIGFLPLGEEPHMVLYGSHLDEPIPAQILEQSDPGVIYFFSKMTMKTQLGMKKKDTKLVIKAKKVELAEKNLEIKRLKTRQLKLYYGKGP